ncbi:MAG: WGR domain-containing protein [Gemmataceae bacterium]|nr:WGR domain-containing protein [Gemmataceae bacterium]
MTRTFEFTGDGSNKFWNIALDGPRFTVNYGRLGTAGQTQVKTFASAEAALKEHDKLVAEKLRKGYRETTPVAAPAPVGGMREALEAALADDPDDLANHMAYADWLAEEGDPRGDFIRLQLRLEDESLPAAERKKLRTQETKLLRKHLAEWLGELGEVIIDPKPHPEHEWRTLKAKYSFRRGWLHSLHLENFGVEDMRVVARSPALALLERLWLHDQRYEEPEDWKPGPDVPGHAADYYPQFYPLLRSPHLGNVRHFTLGEPLSRAEERDADDGAISCYTNGKAAVALVKMMPRLEELHLFAHNVAADELFTLKSLSSLRVLFLYHNDSYPLARLATNPAFEKLEVLRCHPHAMGDETPYLRLAQLKAVVRSKNLPALKHLQLRLSDHGDKGAKEIVESGILDRLRVLDLQHGCITDKGARLLAGCPSLPKLERLDLTDNAMTAAGIAALRATGVALEAGRQWEAGEEGEFGGDEYLFAGDFE